ncbi:MAG: helix-turn-helix domain-containing protein [Proteobacteria bacterium]|nr:helix-turn-helix domain-containing protein [Pseudomonadota bacterium]
MKLDADLCYRALASRDARFDGRFFTGVKTTGIYCRPICPARTPKRSNVRFFACAAAAAEAGFRPCLRCRPEASPGTPAWAGTSASVSRALRLIDEGALDRGGIEDLAARMGMGERHLRRLFDTHLGASPVAVAQTRRIHFAKKLLDETDLPMSEVAFGAGFSSIRRFNAAIRSTYGRSPTEMRKRRRPGLRAGAGANLELRLAYRSPFDWNALVDYLAARAIPGVEAASRESYRRSVNIDGCTGVLEVRPDPDAANGGLVLSIPAGTSRALGPTVERVRRIFDLGADPAAIAAHLSRDRTLAPTLKRHPGLRVPGAWDGFELAVRAILGQQVSVARATELAGKLAGTFGRPLPEPEEGISWIFPPPEVLAEVDIAGLGLMPGVRAEAIRGLAAAVRDGELHLDEPLVRETALEALTSLPGIGPWTAEYVAMRALREPDAFPASDLGLRRAASPSRGSRGIVPARELGERAEAWRPWRAYAAMALWQTGSDASAVRPRTRHR